MPSTAHQIDDPVTPAQYYEMERHALEKHDYYQGEVFDVYAMSGGTSNHSRIKTDLIIALGTKLRGKPCQPYDSDQRIRVTSTGLRTYPDASVFCADLDYDPEDNQRETATNPAVIFEVLSPSTEGYDRGFKAEQYRQIPSLQAYVLIAQDRPHVEILTRSGADPSHWTLTEALGLDADISIAPIEVRLPLAEIYGRVTFDGGPRLP